MTTRTPLPELKRYEMEHTHFPLNAYTKHSVDTYREAIADRLEAIQKILPVTYAEYPPLKELIAELRGKNGAH